MSKYSVPKEEGTARAYGNELRCSPKHSVEISRELKGMDLDEAEAYLLRVQNEKQAVPFKRHNSGAGHRKGIGPGKYPVRAAGEILGIIRNVRNNADQQGLDEDRLRVKHIAAHRGRSFESFRPRAFGRASPTERTTTNLEVVVEEY